MKKEILVLSSFTVDRIINETGEVVKEQAGGPAFFIEKALKQENAKYTLNSPSKFVVEILKTEKGEFGRVPKEPSKIKLDLENCDATALLVSTVLKEVQLNNLNKYIGKVFLDVQGFVRDGTDFGEKKAWLVPKVFTEKLFCVKGTEEEISYLPKDFVNKQKNMLLLITKGRYGCEIYYKGVFSRVHPKRQVATYDTIGAGDTFFAHFIAHFLRTRKVILSVRYAMGATSSFLESKR